MDRGSSKHGRHLDEQMRREMQPYLQGPPTGGRTTDWRDAEPRGADDEPDISPIPRPDAMPIGDHPTKLSNAVRERRSRIGVFLPRTVFPADRSRLIAAASRAAAPEDLLTELDRLPPDRAFTTVAEVWARLGYAVDERF